MTVRSRILGEWLRTHSTWAEASLIGVVLLAATPPYFDALSRGSEPPRPAQVIILLVAACSLLVARRRYPWWTWIGAFTLGLLGLALTESASPVFIPAIIALYSLANRDAGRLVLAAAAASVIVPCVLIIAIGPVGLWEAEAYEMIWWAGLAAAAGIAVRNQRAVVAAADERARRAETTSEEEAQRRVTEERMRIARDLHDVVAHHVSVINVQAGVAGHLMREDPEQAAVAIAVVRRSSQMVLAEVPSLLGLLRTGEHDLETAPIPGLADIGSLVEQTRLSGLDVVWTDTGTPTSLSPGTDLTAYRVIQEGLTNAARHGSGLVRLVTTYGPGELAIEVHNALARPSGDPITGKHGLIGMRERVNTAGGEMTAGPDGIGFWVVRVGLPTVDTSHDEQEVPHP